jgi:hypothetical protein
VRRGKELGYDEFGNPLGEGFDLGGGDEDRVRGERILFHVPGPNWYGHEWHLAQQAVSKRGFSMDILYPGRGGRCPQRWGNSLTGSIKWPT